VTYGVNGNRLRAELTTLLRQHRIQPRLGGPGSYTIPVTTTREQRGALGEQIQRFRWATLMWCLQAVAAANPGGKLAPMTERYRRPPDELHYRLAEALDALKAGLPPLEELTTPQEFPIVESWRQVAKAAVLGEHDFTAGPGRGALSQEQRLAVLKDAAEITQALVVLDRRYDQIPGWQTIPGRGRLDRAAKACAAFAEVGEPDLSVDQHGWRPPSALIEGGPLPGIAGVLQAQHNMLVHLARFPNMLNLRRVIDGQRIVSAVAARLGASVAPDLVERWREREQVYQQLIVQTRNVGGLIGDGGPAVAEAANAVGRLRRVGVGEVADAEPLHDLNKLFTRTDARVAGIIEQGAAERLYFRSVKVPRLVDGTDHLVNPARERYVPITSPVQMDLISITRRGLRPPPVAPTAPAGSHASREELRESIDHHPERRPHPDVPR
jgi:hypothetical protein